MKIKKYLSVASSILEPNGSTSYTADQLYEGIQQLKDRLSQKGLAYNKQEDTQDVGILLFEIYNEKKQGTPVEIKIIPLPEVSGKINFILNHTDVNGKLEVTLPAPGCYAIQITKGSEYEIIEQQVSLEPNQTIYITETIGRIITLDSGWYAGDLHHHSIYSSPVHGGTDPVVETVQEVFESMCAKGLGYGALSDHHNVKNHREWEAVACTEFTPILSKEISTTNGHVMALGVDEDMIYQIPTEEARTPEYLRAEFKRITTDIKNHGGLPQINHPRDTSKAISFPPEFTDIIDIFETMEIWNGSNPMLEGTTNHKAAMLWIELLNQGIYVPATTGSDTHNIKADDYHEIVEELTWLLNTLKPQVQDLPESLQEVAWYLFRLQEYVMPVLDKWIKTNLGTGGVRTYVYSPTEKNTASILQALKKGNSFLTNGPILIPKIDGKIPGQSVAKAQLQHGIHIQLVANKPLTELSIYADGQKVHTVALENSGVSDTVYDYSQTVTGVELQHYKWLVFVAADDYTHMAITNPIFIK